MEYYEFERLEIFKQYHDLHGNEHRLELRYHNLWKTNLSIVCTHIKKYWMKKNTLEKKKCLVDRKNKLLEDIKDKLAKIVVDKFMLYMLSNNKIKLNIGNMPSASRMIMTSKPSLTCVKILSKRCNLSDKQINNLILISKSVLTFHKKMAVHLNFHKIESKKDKIYKQASKYYSSIDSSNEKLAKLVNSINATDRKFMQCDSQIVNLKKAIERENRSANVYITFLLKKIKETKEQYNSEVLKINEKYKDEFTKNGNQTCSICLEEDCRFIKTSCGHFYHVECLGAYIHDIILSRNKIEIKCPYCRQYIT